MSHQNIGRADGHHSTRSLGQENSVAHKKIDDLESMLIQIEKRMNGMFDGLSSSLRSGRNPYLGSSSQRDTSQSFERNKTIPERISQGSLQSWGAILGVQSRRDPIETRIGDFQKRMEGMFDSMNRMFALMEELNRGREGLTGRSMRTLPPQRSRAEIEYGPNSEVESFRVKSGEYHDPYRDGPYEMFESKTGGESLRIDRRKYRSTMSLLSDPPIHVYHRIPDGPRIRAL